MDDDAHRGARALDPSRTASSSRSSSARSSDGYEIIAGERRWRAAQRAGLLKVPVVVRDIPDERLLAVALIENIQREDLNPIEEAVAYRRLADEFHLTQEQIADAVGKDRSSIANYVRLLRLPQEVRDERRVERAVDGPRARAARADRRSRAAAASPATSSPRSLSVRETEALVEEGRRRRPTPKPEKTRRRPHPRRRGQAALRPRHARRASSARAKAARSRSTYVDEDELQRLYELPDRAERQRLELEHWNYQETGRLEMNDRRLTDYAACAG